MAKSVVLCLLCLALLVPFAARAESAVQVKIFGAGGDLEKSFNVFYPDYQGAADLALADYGPQGKRLIVTRGNGNSPLAEVYGNGGVFEYLFQVFGEGFRGGATVAAGDIDGDGRDETVVGAGYLGGPQIRVFKLNENVANFFAYGEQDRKGVRVAVGDIDNDGKDEIIAGPGLNSDPVIKVFGLYGKELVSAEIGINGQGGVNSMAVGDLDGDGLNELAVGTGYGNQSAVVVLDGELKEKSRLYPFGDQYQGGVNVAIGNFDADPEMELVVSPAFHGYYEVKVLDYDGSELSHFAAYDGMDGYAGLALAAGDIDGDGRDEIITLPQRIYGTLLSDAYKFIDVDLAKQTLSFWQDGRKLGSFLISSGKRWTPTPKGVFEIYRKRPSVHMVGADYNLPGVPWVLSFLGAYTIHGTYWHSNFGNPMSHGCVNMFTPQAKLIYDWADVGTPVVVR